MSEYSEDARQHLAFIQAVIARMNSNSFSMKGWMVTVVAALAALYAADGRASCPDHSLLVPGYVLSNDGEKVSSIIR